LGKNAVIPFFSVVIATYNRSKLIQRALQSLIAQTERDWEAIIVDDGSSDNTFKSIDRFLKMNRLIRYIRYGHRGMVPAKNAGIRASAGKYITFLDSDDEYDPRHLETRKSLLMEDPALQFLYGKVKVIGNPYVPDRFDPAQIIHLDCCVAGGSFVFESRALKKLDGFRNLKYGTDADLFDRAAAAGLNRMEVLMPTYIYHHDTAGSNTNSMMMHTV